MKLLKKLPKISKKTVMIAAGLILLLGIPAGYYLLSNNSEDTRAWYNSSWLYRKAITVSNSGSTLTNEQVLITIDTSSLISSSKLQSDCDDLRFLDSDDSTLLDYWVEGGCNTTNTQVWVNIPSLPNGGKTIYVYYGNASAGNAEEAWSGNFISLSSVSCPTGWSRNSSFDNRFPYGSSSYGTTGGADTHTHTVSATTAAYNSDGQTRTTYGAPPYWVAASGHTHTISMTSSTASNLPPYLNLYYCQSSDLNLFQNMVGMINSSSVPTNWSQFTALNGKYPRGAASYGGTGGTLSHTHTTPATNTSGPSTIVDVWINSLWWSAPSNHTHSVSSSTTSSSNMVLPYYSVNYIQLGATSSYPTNLMLMSSAVPPLGWNRFASLDNKLPLGSSTPGSSQNIAGHTHTGSVTLGYSTGTYRAENGGASATAWKEHTHNSGTLSYTTSSSSPLPPYLTTYFVERKSSVNTSVGVETVENATPSQPTSLQTESQTNPTGVTDLTPEFSAIFNDSDSGDTGEYYEVEVNTSSSFIGTVMWDSGKTSISSITNGARSSDISYAGTTLSLNGTTYYWRIRFWDDKDAVSDWSTTANFTMNTTPSQPTSLETEGSTDPGKVTDTTPEFTAIFSDPNTSDTGDYYEIEVNTSSGFDGTVMWDSGKQSITPITNGARSSEISYSGTTLSSTGTTYYWRVKFWDSNDTESSWSSTAQFTMTGNPYQPTELLTDGNTNPTYLSILTPTLSAVHTDPNSDNATYYEIEVNTNSSFTGTVMWDTGKQSMTSTANGDRCPDVTYNGTTLGGDGTTYYWKIRFWDTDGNAGEWSSTAQFTDSYNFFRFEGVGLEGLQIN